MPRNSQQGDLYNGFLFNRGRQFQRPSENALPSFYPNTTQSAGGVSFYDYGTLYGPGPSSYPAQDLQEFPSSSPASSDGSQQSQSPGAVVKDDSRANSKRWDSAEVKILIGAYKTHYNELKSAKSSRGKKAIWEKIHAEFIQACEEASISTDKSLTQVKEKWRTLFEKYKAVCDNNSKTGRGRESFEFYEIIDEFMGCSDKVRPRFVRETAVRNADLQSSPRAESTRDSSESGGVEIPSQDELQNDDHDETPTAVAAASSKAKKAEGKKTRKRKSGAADLGDEETEIIKLLKAQQEAITKAEEKDQKVMEAMLKFQEESEQRHQQLLVSVLGKIGDIFAAKK